MKISREWSMPNKNTFSMKPVRAIIDRWMDYTDGELSIDPFANSNRIAVHCNDIDPAHACQYQMDAIDFLKMWRDSYVDVVLFDPPYSPRQVSECYKALGQTVNMQTTQASFWGNMKKEVGRIVSPTGVVITCGWNSGGMGKSNGFEIQEVLMVPHGGWHNDTIVTVETKIPTLL